MFVAMTLFCRYNKMERKTQNSRKKHNNSTKNRNLRIRVANAYLEKKTQENFKILGKPSKILNLSKRT